MRLTDLKLIEAEDLTDEAGVSPPQRDFSDGKYKVYAADLDYFMHGLEKINKKAKIIGVPPLTIESKVKHVDDDNGIVSYLIQVKGEPVQIKGWKFVATLEHTGGSNVVRGVPGYDPADVKQYIQSSPKNCDFCHSKRDRNHTYIIKKVDDGSGEIKQVGGQCLQKYLGDEARKLVRYSFGMAELVGELTDNEDGGYRGRRGETVLDAMPVLASAAALVTKYGYKKAEFWDSTARFVKIALFGFGSPARDEKNPKIRAEIEEMERTAENPTAADKQHAEEAVKWFNSLPDQEKEASSYLYSLKSILDADYVSPKSVGLLVSLFATYARAKSAPKLDDKTAAKPSEHVGAVGQKIPPVKVKIVHTQIIDSHFGEVQLVKMVDENGNHYTWFNSGAKRYDVDASFTITGTVKKHDEYKGVKQTVLTRPKLTAN